MMPLATSPTPASTPTGSILEAIGETPLVALGDAPPDVGVYAKLEGFNPGGTLMDRVAQRMIEEFLAKGDLGPGGTVVVPTRGAGAVSFALVGAQYDLDVVLVVPASVEETASRTASALGAELVRVRTPDVGTAVARAERIAATRPAAVLANPYEQLSNPDVHYERTAPELFEVLDYEVGAVVVGCDTAGALMGVSRYALDQHRDTWIGAVEPTAPVEPAGSDDGSFEADGAIEGLYRIDASVNPLYDADRVDEVIEVSPEQATRAAARLARTDGLLVGPNSGAASVAARRVAERIADGRLEVPYDTVVTLFPGSDRVMDRGTVEG